MRRFGLILGSGALALAVGCSIFVDTDSLSGRLETDAGGSPDTSIVVVPDADVGDAGVDAGAGCDATFCDDFDQAPLGAKWTSQFLGANTMLAIGTPFLTSPNALHVKLSNPTTAGDAKAFLSRTLGKGSGFRCEVNMFILQGTTNQLFTDVFRVHTTSPGVNDYVLNLGFTGGTSGTFREDVFKDDGTCECPRTGQDPLDIKSGKWVHVVLETDYKTATASFDGVKEATLTLANRTPTGDIRVELGLQGYANTEADVLYDDLVCRLSP